MVVEKTIVDVAAAVLAQEQSKPKPRKLPEIKPDTESELLKLLSETQKEVSEARETLRSALLATRDYTYCVEQGLPPDEDEAARLEKAVAEAREALAEKQGMLAALQTKLDEVRWQAARRETWERIRKGWDTRDLWEARRRYSKAKADFEAGKQAQIAAIQSEIEKKLRTLAILQAEGERELAARVQSEISVKEAALADTERRTFRDSYEHRIAFDAVQAAGTALARKYPELTRWQGGYPTDVLLEDLAGALE